MSAQLNYPDKCLFLAHLVKNHRRWIETKIIFPHDSLSPRENWQLTCLKCIFLISVNLVYPVLPYCLHFTVYFIPQNPKRRQLQEVALCTVFLQPGVDAVWQNTHREGKKLFWEQLAALTVETERWKFENTILRVCTDESVASYHGLSLLLLKSLAGNNTTFYHHPTRTPSNEFSLL